MVTLGWSPSGTDPVTHPAPRIDPSSSIRSGGRFRARSRSTTPPSVRDEELVRERAPPSKVAAGDGSSCDFITNIAFLIDMNAIIGFICQTYHHVLCFFYFPSSFEDV